MPNLGPTELILILLIVIAVFGAGKLANLGGALGKGVKDFRSAMKEPGAKDEDDEEEDITKPKVQPVAKDEGDTENQA